MNTAQQWDKLVSNIRDTMERGIGLKCPFCGVRKVHLIESGILEVECGTRIAIKRNVGMTTNVVTLNAHAIHKPWQEYYPYKEFDCNA